MPLHAIPARNAVIDGRMNLPIMLGHGINKLVRALPARLPGCLELVARPAHQAVSWLTIDRAYITAHQQTLARRGKQADSLHDSRIAANDLPLAVCPAPE